MLLEHRRQSALVKTHCPYCALNCGLQLETSLSVDREPTLELVRWKGSPLTGGALCSKGSTAHHQVRHEDRITAPLIRQGSEFVEVGWDEALDRAAHGFLKIMDRDGAAANAVLSGGSLTNEKVYLIGKLARLAFRTPHVDYNGRFCMAAAAKANTMAFGRDRMMTPLDEIDRAEVAVVIGANLSASFPVVIPKLLNKLRARNGRVVVVDPRASRFVQDNDLFIAPRPGTDAVFFSGLLREIAELGLLDEKFIRNRTTGFEDALEAAAQWHPTAVERATDVGPDLLRQAAIAIGSADRCMYLHGRGPEQQLSGTANVLSIINVGLACGHVGRPGCGINMLTGQRNGQGAREWGQRCNQLPAGRNIDNPSDRAVVARRWGVETDALPMSGKSYVEILQMAGRREIKGLLSICTNMNVSSPDLQAVDQQMAALEHVVMVDPFFSRSARHADVILPGTTFAEEEGTITTIEGRVVLVDQAIAPAAHRADIDVIRNLARRLGEREAFEFHRAAEVFDEMRAVSAGGPVDYSGMTYERLREENGIFWPCPDEDHAGTPQLYTEYFRLPDGRARFHGVDALAIVADLNDLGSREDGLPLVLTTGRVLAQFLSGNQTMRVPAQNAVAPGPYLEVHPSTALQHGLVEGESAVVTSGLGESTIPWVANDRLRLDTVFMPYHWVQCNRLVAADLDPLSGIPGFKYTPVAISPVPSSPGSTANGIDLVRPDEELVR